MAERLPQGAGVVYRPFGSPDAETEGRRLAAVCRRRGLILLVGFDEALALALGGHGLHLPERAVGRMPALQARHPHWIVTGAAHDAAAVARAASAGLHAALLSPVFASASPSAGEPLGLERFSEIARAANLPVYALGGVTAANAPSLEGSGAAGVAAVEGVLEAWAD